MTGDALIVARDGEAVRLLADRLRERGFSPTVLAEGKPALAWARQHRPALIFLGLEAADLDGATICEALKLDRDTNLIPVVTLTPQGQMNHKPACGYLVGANLQLPVPFTPEQLEAVIEQAVDWQAQQRRSGTRGVVHVNLQSDLAYLDELNKVLSSLFLANGLGEAETKQLMMAVRELGANSIEWGHRKQVERLVALACHIDPEKVTVVIRDEGPGFNPNELPHAANPDDPISHLEVRESLGLREGGFGIMIVRGLVDELQYNECGNEVRLVKYLSPGPLADPAATSETKR
jgi:anti-sigma regulatory factor (Ser/Thr protein kinase)/CheY-like chemotaxis protein